MSQVSDITLLGLILSGLAVDGVIHQLEELLLHRVIRGSTEISILDDVVLEQA